MTVAAEGFVEAQIAEPRHGFRTPLVPHALVRRRADHRSARSSLLAIFAPR